MSPRKPRSGGRKRSAPPAINLQAMADDLALVTPADTPRLLRSTRAVPPLVELRQPNTSRLLPARYSDSMLTRIADSDEDLQAIYALDNATNERLLAEANNRLGITAAELVDDVPYARIINAAFAHPHPLGARFSTPYRGAWYAGFDLQTAKAEVLFHRSLQLGEIRWQQPEDLDYDHYYADFAGSFHDLREPAQPDLFPPALRLACLSPDSYLASQQLAVELLETGSPGVIYPSTRRTAGTCVACFHPAMVTNVRKRDLHRLTWRPDAPLTFARIQRPRNGAPGPVLASSAG